MLKFGSRRLHAVLVLVVFAAMCTRSSQALPPAAGEVLKATLRNGLQVVIVRNTLAPVISTDMTYLVGSRDDPAAVPGMAHAQEHMMFRGTKNLSTSELGTLATALGGAFNASTSDTITQYQFSVQASDFDAVLRIESDRMRDVLDAQSQWQNERGAIEQEVLRDESAPGADFFASADAVAFAGTHYARSGVGTKAAFDRLTGPQIKAFYERWYAPNNAVFVVAGDVDPARTLAEIRARFESIPQRAIPPHAIANLQPLRRVVMRRSTTLVYPLAAVGFRMPGLDSPDFLASFVLQEVLNAQRGALHELGDTGEALEGEWIAMPYVPEAQLGFATAALSQGADPGVMAKRLEDIVLAYARNGVPADIFESTKRQLIAGQELSRNSLESLASDWATTIALDRQPSIAREQELLAKVTLSDVNRVAKRYLDVRHAIVGELTPSANASLTSRAAPSQTGPEKPLDAQPPVTHLPDWANQFVEHVALPGSSLSPTTTKLANGITLIVQPETISDSVFLFGRVKTNAGLQEPAAKEGVSGVLAGIFPNGTQTRDRAAFQRAQDALDTSLAAGDRFGLQTTSPSFDRAVDLLAENELTPRFDAATFELARRRAVDELGTALNSSATVASRRAAAKLLPAGDPALREPTLSGLQALTLDDVKAYYAATMRPDLTTIVVIGNVTPQGARSAVERAFGLWHATGDAPSLVPPAVPLNAAGEVRLDLPAMGQDDVRFEQIVTLPRSAPDVIPLQLGNAILGGGSAGPEQSRLFRDLRQNAGLVYSIESQLASEPTRSQFSVEYACLPANQSRIATLVDAEIERMKSQPVGDFELALMKASIVRRTTIAAASVGAIGGSLLDDASDGLPLDQDRLDAAQYLATEAPAVQRAFSEYIHPENFVRIVQGP